MTDKQELFRRLPAVHQLLQQPQVEKQLQTAPRHLVVEAIREVLDQLRQEIQQTASVPDDEVITGRVLQLIETKKKPRLRRVINGTGVVLHTNLGRAILSQAAVDAVVKVAGGYSNLEYDLEEGKRGSRHSHIEELVCQLTRAPAAMVVNNNAAAVLIVLSALAKDREVIVSRGELVEIGGSFRVPEVMSQSGAILREVGTTNKTYARDYEQAINENTGVLLKVHTSNYRVVGFTHETTREELVALGRKYSLPVIEDLGSGSLIDLAELGLPGEPTVQQCLNAGVDIVTFSGDKLLGGTQAGFIVGKRELVERIKSHPLARAIRVDKMTIAGLEATLRAYLDKEQLLQENPTVRMLSEPAEVLKKRAEHLAALLSALPGAHRVATVPGKSKPGGGALPTTELDTWLVEIQSDQISAENLAASLRKTDPPVIVRVQEGKVMIDPRTLLPGDEKLLVKVFHEVLTG